MSCTVTTAVQLAVFELTSVTVSVTLLAPIFEQVKLEGETDAPASAQLSPLAAVTMPAVILAVVPPSTTEIS